MFSFKLDTEIPLLTITRTGLWTSRTVSEYETALRRELTELHRHGSSTAVIVDIRSSDGETPAVSEELRAMVGRLGPLHARRIAVVTSSGIAKLEARRATDVNAQVFTSMVLARDWIKRDDQPRPESTIVYDKPSDARADGPVVHVRGPADIDIRLTPGAAIETAKRLGDAAVDVLLDTKPALARQKRIAIG